MCGTDDRGKWCVEARGETPGSVDAGEVAERRDACAGRIKAAALRWEVGERLVTGRWRVRRVSGRWGDGASAGGRGRRVSWSWRAARRREVGAARRREVGGGSSAGGGEAARRPDVEVRPVSVGVWRDRKSVV